MQRPGRYVAKREDAKRVTALPKEWITGAREKIARATKANVSLSEDVLMENAWGSFMKKENDHKYLNVIEKHQRKCVVVLERLIINEEEHGIVNQAPVHTIKEEEEKLSYESDFSASSKSEISEQNKNAEFDSDFSWSAKSDLSDGEEARVHRKKKKNKEGSSDENKTSVKKTKKRGTKSFGSEISDESDAESNKAPRKRKVKKNCSGENDYMKMVEANRLQKMAFLESLKINEVKESLCSSVKALKPKRVSKPKPPVIPREKIKRSSKVNINLSEDHIWKKSLKDAVEAYNVDFSEIPKEELPYEFSFKVSEKEEDLFRSFSKDSKRTLNLKDPKNSSSCFERIDSWNCLKRDLLKNNISAMSTHPSLHMFVVAGDNSGNIGFWNVVSDTLHSFRSHSEKVTDVKFNPYYPNLFLSSSSDGRLSCGDMENFICDTYYENSTDGCSSFDVLSSTTFVVGHFSGLIDIVDSRKCGRVQSNYKSSTQSVVRSLNVHPVDPNLFVSSENNGSIKVWDVRSFDKKHLSKYSCTSKYVPSSAYFSPVNGNHILATVGDGTCCIFYFYHTFINKDLHLKNKMKFKDMKKYTNAQWLPWLPEHFSINSQHPPRIAVYDHQKTLNRDIVHSNLGSSKRIAFHPFLPLLFSTDKGGNVTFLYDTVLEAYRN